MSTELCQEMLFSGKCSKGAACQYSHISENGLINNHSIRSQMGTNGNFESSRQNKMDLNKASNEIDKIFSSVNAKKETKDTPKPKIQHPSKSTSFKNSDNKSGQGKPVDHSYSKGKQQNNKKNYTKGVNGKPNHQDTKSSEPKPKFIPRNQVVKSVNTSKPVLEEKPQKDSLKDSPKAPQETVAEHPKESLPKPSPKTPQDNLVDHHKEPQPKPKSKPVAQETVADHHKESLPKPSSKVPQETVAEHHKEPQPKLTPKVPQETVADHHKESLPKPTPKAQQENLVDHHKESLKPLSKAPQETIVDHHRESLQSVPKPAVPHPLNTPHQEAQPPSYSSHPTYLKGFDTDVMVSSPPSHHSPRPAPLMGMDHRPKSMPPMNAMPPMGGMPPIGGMPPRNGDGMGYRVDPLIPSRESMQVIPIMPSITVSPQIAYPGCEIEVNIVIRESDYKPDDWIGLFKSYQHQPNKAITQRHVCKLHFSRMMSNGDKLKKFSCRFYAPKHGGRYVFRYFQSSNYFSFLNSNEVVVTIRGCDLDEAVDFVEQKIDEPSMLLFNINSLYSTVQYIIDLENWRHPEKLKGILTTFISPLYEEKIPDNYTTQVCSNLNHLLSSIIHHPYLMAVLGNEWSNKLRSLLHHFCHICNLFIMKDEEFEAHMRGRHSLPAVCNYERFSKSFLNLLTNQAVKEFREMCPLEGFYKTREDLINRLVSAFHQHKNYENSIINIYGSSNNGFGTDGSDIDLCLIDQSLDTEKIIDIADEIASILASVNMVDIDKSRLHARIPVIRFEDPKSSLQCDLCFNNILPIRNTLLLKTYSFIDPRVRVLGIIIKKWAKMNNLNNPIYKTLSSYGYMLMLIHFLQSAVDPPLLPILQKLPPNWNGMPIQGQPQVPTALIESYEGVLYDTYFYHPRDLVLLNRFAQRNTMTVGELLVDFFYYYGYEYDYIHSVVTIRQKGVLDREEKCCDSIWKMMMQLCIEDPFEIDYDVAHVITPTSSSMIQECFAKSYVMLQKMNKDFKEMDEPDLLEALFKIALYH